jgi:hypothetical protein
MVKTVDAEAVLLNDHMWLARATLEAAEHSVRQNISAYQSLGAQTATYDSGYENELQDKLNGILKRSKVIQEGTGMWCSDRWYHGKEARSTLACTVNNARHVPPDFHVSHGIGAHMRWKRVGDHLSWLIKDCKEAESMYSQLGGWLGVDAKWGDRVCTRSEHWRQCVHQVVHHIHHGGSSWHLIRGDCQLHVFG